MTSFDIYPLEGRAHPSVNQSGAGAFELYAEAVDQLISRNYNLIPAFSCIESQDLWSENKSTPPGCTPGVDCYARGTTSIWTPGPTPEQLRFETWLNVIHGIKGIAWFHYFEPIPAENYLVMEEFVDQITRLTDVVLGPDSEINLVDSANEHANRVDSMIKENDTDIFIFSVRVTEPDYKWSDTGYEPESISVNFDLGSSVSGDKVYVFDEGRQINLVNGKFTDSFDRYEVHIYRIPKTFTCFVTLQDIYDKMEAWRNRTATLSEVMYFIRNWNTCGKPA